MYHKDFTYLIKSNIEKKRAFDRSGHVSQTYKKKMKKNCSYKLNTPRYTSMSLYNSINTPSYTTSTTNMYHTDVPADDAALDVAVPTVPHGLLHRGIVGRKCKRAGVFVNHFPRQVYQRPCYHDFVLGETQRMVATGCISGQEKKGKKKEKKGKK
jgi:hypothetical protein